MPKRNAPDSLRVADTTYGYFSLTRCEAEGLPNMHLPFSLRILLENLLRHEDGRSVTRADIEALCRWNPAAEPDREISFMPARVLLQDFTGVPAVVDLAAMRDVMKEMGGDPSKINPLIPAELVIDHSVQVDAYGSEAALFLNAEKEFERNKERYAFLRWGQKAFRNFAVVPPDTGIVHQVNIEYLARVVFDRDGLAYPDTLVGTDSHTTMANGLGVLGWGVGGIEAEAAMLGQAIPLLIPQVVGFRLVGALPEGATATDLVLRVTEMLRKKGVVGKFVEFFGKGLAGLSLADRATIANMAPEYGATCGIFPIDRETIEYLRFTGRDAARVDLVEAYAKAQGLYREEGAPDPIYSDTLELDMTTVEPAMAGPKRPQDRVALGSVAKGFREALPGLLAAAKKSDAGGGAVASANGDSIATAAEAAVGHGSVVIAAITSCTNTSNPSVMLAAGLLAKKAVAKGLTVKPWVKTSLAPGSKVVTEYLKAAGVMPALEALRFHVVGYGCTTCIGNSGPLPEEISREVNERGLVVAAVLSGNRNFEGRVNPDVRANYLASPPLCVAYAIAGRIDWNPKDEPIGRGADGKDVFLKDIWPTQAEISAAIRGGVKPEQFKKEYADVFAGDPAWRGLVVPEGDRFAWSDDSTYVQRPTFLRNIPRAPAPRTDIAGARALAVLGDSITTDHISPAGAIKKDGPAAKYLNAKGVAANDFNSYGSRRGNHEVMIRGTFANIRLKNLLAPGTEGGVTRHLPGGEGMSIFDAAERYAKEGVALVVLAGKEYGSGSSRDWAAKGTALLGIRAVIAESYERIHRSNLIGMGVLPLQFLPGENAAALGLTGEEIFAVGGIASGLAPGATLVVQAGPKSFRARCRIDTPVELEYYRHGGILPYVLRSLLSS